jgi:Tfp pilus assembly protein PilF
MQGGDLVAAASCYSRALELDPTQGNALNKSGWLLCAVAY